MTDLKPSSTVSKSEVHAGAVHLEALHHISLILPFNVIIPNNMMRIGLMVLLLAATGFQQARALQAESDPEKRLAEMGIEMGDAPQPVANYVTAVRTGNLVFLAGHGPALPEGGYVTGKVGEDLTVDEGYQAARLTGISLLKSLKAEIDDLSKVTRIVKVTGMVNSTADFEDHPAVINGMSDLMVEIFGESIGKHARAAVGMNSLPINIAVEIEMVVEVRE